MEFSSHIKVGIPRSWHRELLFIANFIELANSYPGDTENALGAI